MTEPSTQALIAAVIQNIADLVQDFDECNEAGDLLVMLKANILAITHADVQQALDNMLMKVARAALLSDRASSKGTFNDADLRDIIAKVKNEPQHP